MWLDPAIAKEVSELLALDTVNTMKAARVVSPNLVVEAASVKEGVGNIDPASVNELISQVRELTRVLDLQRSIRERIVISGLPAHGKVLSDAARLARSTAVARALSIDRDELSRFAGGFNDAFPIQDRWVRIDSVIVAADAFTSSLSPVPAGLSVFLAEVTKASGGKVPTGAQDKIRANLRALAEVSPDLNRALRRYDDLSTLESELRTYQAEDGSLYKLQERIDELGRATVSKATALNVAARKLPLSAPFDLLPAGVWFASRQITLTLKQGQRTALFDVGGVSDTSRVLTVGGETAAAKPTMTAVTAETTARIFRFRVYNTYHFQLGLGFVYSGAPDDRFQVFTVTEGSGATATTKRIVEQIRSRSYNLLATADVMIFPAGRHRFPFRSRFLNEKPPPFYQDFGALLGFSLTSPNRDFLLGGVFFPRQSAIGIKFGWHLALRDYPPKGVALGVPLPATATVLNQTLKNGAFVGLSFTTDFFGRVFAPIFKP